MPILDLQMRMRELGRIRIGQKVPTSGGKTRPEKLDRFRFTSASQTIIEAVAGLYGGTAREWTPTGGSQQWEVITDTRRIPVLVPPQPISQFYELWSGGGCQRRCDGQRELLSDQQCMCEVAGQEGADRECKPTTRLNVMLRDSPGVGLFRLESHGYYAAVELPQLAGFLAKAAAEGTYVPAFLGLEERTVRRPGSGVKKFMVPTLDIDITPAALMAGNGSQAPPAIEPPARPAIASGEGAPDPRDLARLAGDATTIAELDGLRKLAEDGGVWCRGIEDAITARRAQLIPAGSGDPDEIWAQIVRHAPEDWTTTQLETSFTNQLGVTPHEASADQLALYLDSMEASA